MWRYRMGIRLLAGADFYKGAIALSIDITHRNTYHQQSLFFATPCVLCRRSPYFSANRPGKNAGTAAGFVKNEKLTINNILLLDLIILLHFQGS